MIFDSALYLVRVIDVESLRFRVFRFKVISMKKFFQISAVCLLAVSLFATVGCGEAEKKPADTTTTSETGGDAVSDAKPEAGSEAKKEGSDSH